MDKEIEIPKATTDIKSPGVFLKHKLKENGYTQKAFASMLAIQPPHLSEIIRGKRKITSQLSLKLEEALHIPSLVWLRMQAEYDLKMKASNGHDQEEELAEQELIEYDTIYDMHCIFKHIGMTKEKAQRRLKFCKDELHFDTPSVQRAEIQGYFHRSEKTGLDTRMIATWAVLAHLEASREQKPIGIFDVNRCDELSEKLSDIFNDNYNTISRVKHSLSEYGIKFSIVKKLPHASIDGYTFFCDGIPAIVVTKRFDRIDNFAFAVLHELGHLKLHLAEGRKGTISIVDPDAEKPTKEEQQANDFAANALIPQDLWIRQPEVRLIPPLIQKRFSKWAKEINKNKWIVLGRIAHETNIYMFKTDPSRSIH